VSSASVAPETVTIWLEVTFPQAQAARLA